MTLQQADCCSRPQYISLKIIGMACIGHSNIYTCKNMRNEDPCICTCLFTLRWQEWRLLQGERYLVNQTLPALEWCRAFSTGAAWSTQEPCYEKVHSYNVFCRNGKQALQVFKARYLEPSSSMIICITSALNNGLNAAAFDHQFWKNYLKLTWENWFWPKKNWLFKLVSIVAIYSPDLTIQNIASKKSWRKEELKFFSASPPRWGTVGRRSICTGE